jgi:lipopolysaccharide export system permease protein
MPLISRYILKAHIGPFIFAFTVITFILVMDVIFEIANLIIGKGLDLVTVFEIFVLNLAWIVALSIPMSVLVATLMAFGRLSADNEITGLKAGGVSFYRMIAPPLIAGAFLAVGNLYFMDRVLPEANYRARALMNDVHRARPTLGFREGIFMNQIPGYSILIDRINPRGNDISSVTVYETVAPGMPRILTAREGELDISPDGSRITLTLFHGEMHYRDPEKPERYFREVFERQRIAIRETPVGLQRSEAGIRNDREMSIAMMREKVEVWRLDMQASRQRLATLDPSARPDDEARAQQEIVLIESRQQQINGYLVEIQKKYAIPLACMIFVLIGAPLGMKIRRSGLGISVGVSLGFFLLYWACLIGGEELADRNLVSPALAMWSANILLSVSGLVLLFQTARERLLLR